MEHVDGSQFLQVISAFSSWTQIFVAFISMERKLDDVSVCLSVRPSHADIDSTQWRSFNHPVAQGLKFLVPIFIA